MHQHKLNSAAKAMGKAVLRVNLSLFMLHSSSSDRLLYLKAIDVVVESMQLQSAELERLKERLEVIDWVQVCDVNLQTWES